MTEPEDRHEWLSFEDPEEDRTWLFDLTFLLSRWSCIYGRGCPGIDSRADIGCCSHGAYFTDDADRGAVEAAVASLAPEQWQFAEVGRRRGIVARASGGGWKTRVHQGGCILLNRAGFPAGAGCALHQAALQTGRRPMDLKPDVCWQVPLRRVDSVDEVGHVTSTIREWKRRDWDEGGQEFHWWCIEESAAFVGADTVLATMADELAALVGPGVHALLLGALAERTASTTVLPHPATRTSTALS
ncbi:MAG TPA: hypothetical protein VGR26_14535 [Acidimicrobiales bacterium]|nr:hypothetical protein [Acidimicrobiales bacterium]